MPEYPSLTRPKGKRYVGRYEISCPARSKRRLDHDDLSIVAVLDTHASYPHMARVSWRFIGPGTEAQFEWDQRSDEYLHYKDCAFTLLAAAAALSFVRKYGSQWSEHYWNVLEQTWHLGPEWEKLNRSVQFRSHFQLQNNAVHFTIRSRDGQRARAWIRGPECTRFSRKLVRLIDRWGDSCYRRAAQEDLVTLMQYVRTGDLQALLANDHLKRVINNSWASGRTPLMWACIRHDANMVRALINFGSDPSMLDARGRSALSFAKSKEIVSLLSAAIGS